jgi:hypothetical protein
MPSPDPHREDSLYVLCLPDVHVGQEIALQGFDVEFFM